MYQGIELSNLLHLRTKLLLHPWQNDSLTPSPSKAAPKWWSPFLSSSTRSAAYVWLGSGWWPTWKRLIHVKLIQNLSFNFGHFIKSKYNFSGMILVYIQSSRQVVRIKKIINWGMLLEKYMCQLINQILKAVLTFQETYRAEIGKEKLFMFWMWECKCL